MVIISDIKTTVSAPSEIDITLIRADHHATANIFRMGFEIFLAFCSATAGALMAMKDRPGIYVVILVICAVLGAVCLKFTFSYGRSSSARE